MQLTEQYTDNPLKGLGYETDNILPDGGFGAILARAGVGKTSFIVQLALNSMMRNQEVLHISLDDPVQKINLWYQEIFHLRTNNLRIEQQRQLWEMILPYRFILTMQVDGFSVLRLEERMKDLIEQKIFTPKMIMIDGLPFDETVQKTLLDLKPLIRELNTHVWFTVKTHRHEAPGTDGLPIQIADIVNFFDTVVQLQPEGKQIFIQNLKGGQESLQTGNLVVDPSTMLIQKQ